MIAVARFDVDETSPVGRRLLLERAFTPRSRGEAVRLALLLGAEKLLGRSDVALLARPSSSRGAAPAHDESLAAVADLLGDAAWESALSIVRPAHAPPARLLHLHRRGASRPELVAKVAHVGTASAVAALHREEDALRRVASTRAVGPIVPPVVAAGQRRDLAVLVQRDLGEPSLARRHRLRPAGTWSIETHCAIGRCLGTLHAETRDGASAFVHGDAWSRNLLVRRDGALAGLVDWEAASHGAPVSDALGFLLRSGDADLAGRGARSERIRSDGGRLARWLLVGDRGAAPAGRALLVEWATALGPGVVDDVLDDVLADIGSALRSGTLLNPPRPADEAAIAAVARALAPLLRPKSRRDP